MERESRSTPAFFARALKEIPLFSCISHEKTRMLAIEFYCVLTLLFILAIPPTSALTADTGEIETITRNLCNLSRFTGSEEEATE